MISEERLKELIKQETTIYSIGIESIFEHKLDKYCYIGIADNTPSLMKTYCDFDDDVQTELIEHIECLFETKEETEEYLEYGNITRTEKFPYMSWEEFCEGKKMRFDGKNGFSYCCEIGCISQRFIVVYKPLTYEYIFKGPATRENYHKALDICVKLWKGEE